MQFLPFLNFMRGENRYGLNFFELYKNELLLEKSHFLS